MEVTGKLYPTEFNASGIEIGVETPEEKLFVVFTGVPVIGKELEEVLKDKDELIRINNVKAITLLE